MLILLRNVKVKDYIDEQLEKVNRTTSKSDDIIPRFQT